MNKVYWMVFKWLARKIVMQGGQSVKIRTAYKIIHDSANDVYREETWLATDSFMSKLYAEQRCGIGSFDVNASINKG